MRLYPENVLVGQEAVLRLGKHFLTDDVGSMLELYAQEPPIMVRGAMIWDNDSIHRDKIGSVDGPLWLEAYSRLPQIENAPLVRYSAPVDPFVDGSWISDERCYTNSVWGAAGLFDVASEYALVRPSKSGFIVTPYGVARPDTPVLLPIGLHPYHMIVQRGSIDPKILTTGNMRSICPAGSYDGRSEDPGNPIYSMERDGAVIEGDVERGSQYFLGKGYFVRSGKVSPTIDVSGDYTVCLWMLTDRCGLRESDLAIGNRTMRSYGCEAVSVDRPVIARFWDVYISIGGRCGPYVGCGTTKRAFFVRGNRPRSYYYIAAVVRNSRIAGVYFGVRQGMVTDTGVTLPYSHFADDTSYPNGFWCKNMHVAGVQVFDRVLTEEEIKFAMNGGRSDG